MIKILFKSKLKNVNQLQNLFFVGVFLLSSFSLFAGSKIVQKMSSSCSSTIVPLQSFTVTSEFKTAGSDPLTNVLIDVNVTGELTVQSCVFYNKKNKTSITGVVNVNGLVKTVSFSSVPNLVNGTDYEVVTTLVANFIDASGQIISNGSSSNVKVNVGGKFGGTSYNIEGLSSFTLNTNDQSLLIFSEKSSNGVSSISTDSWSVSAIDYDNDNDDDLFFTDMTANQPNRLFKNNGSGIFTAVTTGAIVTDLAQSMSSSWADFDNDGDLDVVVANTSVVPCFFYENNGNGTFSKNITAGFTKQNGYYHHVSWVDVDNDGKLELYLGNYLPTRFNELWKRNTVGTWELWSDNLLSKVVGSSTGATWADYDKDGYQDLVLMNNEGGKNRMYHNLGNGQFEAVSNVITATGGRSVASVWGDIDNDGDLDLFISNSGDINNDLFLNNGGGAFSKVTIGEVVTDGGHSHGAAFADVDKDGDLDLYVANDHGVKFLYYNNGSGIFTKQTGEALTVDYGLAFGVAFSDFDADGDMDLVTSTHSNQKDHLYLKNTNSNKYYKIRLVGVASNKSGIGARIRLKANGVWQTREVNSQSGFGGQSSYRQHFGIGNASKVDSVIVYWPSGTIQTLKNLSTNQNTVITESSSTLVTAKVFYDVNKNCVLDVGESPLKNVKLSFNNGKFSAMSNENGEVSIYLAKGSYTVAIDGNEFVKTCNLPTSFSVNTTSGAKDIGLFALRPVCDGSDFKVDAYTVMLRRGFPCEYLINVQNQGLASNSNVVLTATIPSNIQVDSASIDWATSTLLNGNTVITWNLGTLNYKFNQSIKLFIKVPISVELGTNIQSVFTLTGDGNECNSSNNTYTDLQTVYGSVDPNDLLAFPNGETENHFINRKQVITYKIRFQNVGNFPADFVNLVDELPQGLDVASISNITASHRYEMSTEGNKLMFHFPSINLPDSTSDLEGSNGFVQFNISLENDVPNGLIVENKANIQFDYNEFIQTNTVFYTVLVSTNKDNKGTLILFPNPANDHAFAKISLDEDVNPEITNIEVFTLMGEKVYEEECNSSVLKIEVGELPIGSYMVVAKDIIGRVYSGKLIISRL